jgi:hypothetical protein
MRTIDEHRSDGLLVSKVATFVTSLKAGVSAARSGG